MSTPVVFDARVVSGPGGGPDKTILLQPRFLEPLGYRNVCGYLHPPGDPGFEVIRDRAARESAPLIGIPDGGPFDRRVVGRLLEAVRAANAVVWHGHDYKTNLLGLILRRFHPMRLVTTVHGWVQQTRRTPLYYALDRMSLRFYERVFCVSPDLMAACRRAGVPRSRCVLLENGIDLANYQRSAPAPIGGRFVIAGAGRLSPEKAFGDLIAAVGLLAKRGRDVELRIAGDGPDRARLEAVAASAGVAERVRFLGWQADLRPVLEGCHLFALPSLREGLPNVLLEAMAMRVPVVASRIAGIPRLLDGGRCGELVEPGRPAELAERIAALMDDPARLATLAESARMRVEERYSFAARMRVVAAHYGELLAGRPR